MSFLFRIIFVSVLFVHIGFVFRLVYATPAPVLVKHTQKLKVMTISLKEEMPHQAVKDEEPLKNKEPLPPKVEQDVSKPKSKQDIPKPKVEQDVSKPKSKQDVPKPKSRQDVPKPKENKNTAKPKDKKEEKSAVKPISSDALVNARAALRNIDLSTKKQAVAGSICTLPKAIESLSAESNALSSSYREQIAKTIAERLKLPVKGSVKAQVVVLSSGKIETVKILSAESERNRQYVEQKLPALSFPSFGKEMKNAASETFTIVLKEKS